MPFIFFLFARVSFSFIDILHKVPWEKHFQEITSQKEKGELKGNEDETQGQIYKIYTF